MQDALTFSERKRIAAAYNAAIDSLFMLHGVVSNDAVRELVGGLNDALLDARSTVLTRAGEPAEGQREIRKAQLARR
jgi:hypothetical protein